MNPYKIEKLKNLFDGSDYNRGELEELHEKVGLLIEGLSVIVDCLITRKSLGFEEINYLRDSWKLEIAKDIIEEE